MWEFPLPIIIIIFSLFFVNLVFLVHYHQEGGYAQQKKQILYRLEWLDWLVYG